MNNTLFVIIATLLITVAATSLVSAHSHWIVEGSGFHRTATFEVDYPPSQLSSKAIIGGDEQGALTSISLAFEIPADFYIDVNELWKRSSLSIEEHCDSTFIKDFRQPHIFVGQLAVHRVSGSASHSRFAGAASDAPIDIEGPSFRTKTVPRKTRVTLNFTIDSAAVAAASQEVGAIGDALDECAVKAPTMHFMRVRLTLPMHARYALPVGTVPMSHMIGHAFAPEKIQRLLAFEEHVRELPFSPALVETVIVSGSKKRIVAPFEFSKQGSSILTRSAVKWSMPAADAQLAHLVFWATTVLIITAALGVMIAAVVPV